MTTVAPSVVTEPTNVSLLFEEYIADASVGAIVLTLPEIVSDGMIFGVKRSDAAPSANAVTVQAAAGDTIEGLPSLALADGDAVRLISVGSDWKNIYPALARSAVVAFSSGTIPVVLTLQPDGSAATGAVVGFGSSVTDAALVGPAVGGFLPNAFAFAVSRAGAITSLALVVTIAVAVELTEPVTVTASLYGAVGSPPGPVAPALSPVGVSTSVTLSGILAPGQVFAAPIAASNVPVVAGDRLVLVLQPSGNPSVAVALTLGVSAGLTVD